MPELTCNFARPVRGPEPMSDRMLEILQDMRDMQMECHKICHIKCEVAGLETQM